MIVLDTNVVSEVLRPGPTPRVVAWIESVSEDLAITTITMAELLVGVRRMPSGRRKTELTANVERALAPFRGTNAILPFDEVAAERYSQVVVAREKAGRPISTADAEIAAISLAHNATCATRNTKDFRGIGLTLVDPWS